MTLASHVVAGYGRMEHFVEKEQPVTSVLMVLVGGQERFLLPAA
jgi:hypothetical protein